jgi:alpha-N-acetylglucosaminidase
VGRWGGWHGWQDVNTLLQSHSGFLLGSWLADARLLGGSNETLADFYEWNARAQITTWTPVSDPADGLSPLNDYARKEWAGMISTYYTERVQIWLNHTLGLAPEPDLSVALASFARQWQHTRWDPQQLPAAPVGDPVTLSRQLLARYPAQ